MTPFENKVAVVTGGASGIGRALGKALIARGARVVLADIDGPGLEERKTELGDVDTEIVDVTDADAVRKLVDGAAERHGSLDFMFNNAGIAVLGEAYDLPLDGWNRVLDINVRGVVHGTLAAYDIMRRQGSGHIVNTGSLAGLLPSPGLAAYATSKHAVVGLSKTLRVEAAEYGVKVSVVCPGVIDTPLTQNIDTVNMDQAAALEQIARAPLTFGAPDDCARDILRGVEKNRAVILVTAHGKLMVWAFKWMPGLVYRIAQSGLAKGRKALQE